MDFFGPLLLTNFDGADLSWTTACNCGQDLRVKLSAGRSQGRIPVSGQPPIDLSGGQLFGVTAEYMKGGFSLRAAYAQIQLATPLIPSLAYLQTGLNGAGAALNDPNLTQLADEITIWHRYIKYSSVGLNWQRGSVQLEAAGARVLSGTWVLPNFKSGFVSLGYRMEKVVPYLLVSRIVTQTADPQVGSLAHLGPAGVPLTNGVSDLLRAIRANQTTVSAGLRWDFCSQADLKCQVDRMAADPNSQMLFSAVQPGWDGRATLVSLLLDFVF